MSPDEAKRLLEEQRDYCLTWLERLKQAYKIEPHVARNIELLAWATEALDKRPKEADGLQVNSAGDLKVLEDALPMIPDYPEMR